VLKHLHCGSTITIELDTSTNPFRLYLLEWPTWSPNCQSTVKTSSDLSASLWCFYPNGLLNSSLPCYVHPFKVKIRFQWTRQLRERSSPTWRSWRGPWQTSTT